MQSMDNRSGWKAMVLAAAMAAGCEHAASERAGGARLLTGIEMDRVTAGSAMAVSEVEARALGSAPQTTAFTSTVADSGGSPIAGAPFLNYANSQAAASASNGAFLQAGGSSEIRVDGGNGGVRTDIASTSSATGSDSSHAEVNIQFTGISMRHLDLVYGSVAAIACCNPFSRTQAKIDSAAGGPYMSQLQGAPVSDIPGQVQSRIDAAVASSTLPLLDAGQALTVTAPRLWESINQ